MPTPNFTKNQAYPYTYGDNTQYIINSTTPSPASYPWSFAPAGVPPAYGQFPNPNILSNSPSLFRLTILAFGPQGATPQGLATTLSVFGTQIGGLQFAAGNFGASTGHGFKLVTDFSIIPNGNLLALEWGCVSPNGESVGGTSLCIALSLAGQGVVEGGGIIQYLFSWTSVATGPSLNIYHNYIEIMPQLCQARISRRRRRTRISTRTIPPTW